jgi:two-component system nitrogen regulation response regulator GlnG
LRLPSLRERREDIPLLTRHFLAQSAKQLGVEAKRMSDRAMQFLASLDLPGNVRQLENLCNWITVMAPGQTVEVKDLPQDLIDERGLMPGTTSLTGPASTDVTALMPATTDSHDAVGVASANGDAYPAGAQPVHPNGRAEKDSWTALLEMEAANMLSAGEPEVMDALGRQFESTLIRTALKHTHGRKNDAAVRLGIGRNTITRKIQELGIAGVKDD